MENKNESNFFQDNRKRIIILLVFLFVTFIFWYADYSFSNLEVPQIKDNPIIIPDPKPKDDGSSKKDDKPHDVPIIPALKPQEEEIIDPGIFSVRDEETKWNTITELKIFQKVVDQKLVVNGKLAPGMSDSYDFVVRNNTGFEVLYLVELAESNPSNFDMRYRLKKGTNYVIGNADTWVKVADISLTSLELKNKQKETYTLEWMWVEGNNDTYYGTHDVGTYQLGLKVTAEEKL